MRKRVSSLDDVLTWYPVELPISYQGLERGSVQGIGRTVEMSSNAIRFGCDRNLPVGLTVRLSIQWPAKLGDGTSLSLSAIGKIERAGFCEAEAVLIRYEFRTRGAESANRLLRTNEMTTAAG